MRFGLMSTLESLDPNNLASLVPVFGAVAIFLAIAVHHARKRPTEPPKESIAVKSNAPHGRHYAKIAKNAEDDVTMESNESMQMLLMDPLAMPARSVVSKKEAMSEAKNRGAKSDDSKASEKRKHTSCKGGDLEKLRKTLRSSVPSEHKSDQMQRVQPKDVDLDQARSKVQTLTKKLERQEAMQHRIRLQLWSKKKAGDTKSQEKSNEEALTRETVSGGCVASSRGTTGQASSSSSIPFGKSGSVATIPFMASEVVVRPMTAAIHFKYHGVALVQDALSAELAAECASFIDQELAIAQKAVAENPKLERKYFGSIQTRENRWDLKIRLGKEARAALRVLGVSLGSLFQNILVDGGASVMCEFCCIVSDPGAKRQPLHPDTVIEDETSKGLVTTFIALQDTSYEMGPTVVCPGTHTKAAQTLLKSLSSNTSRTHDWMIEAMGGVHACCSAGTAVVMDSRLVHAGGANLDGKDGPSRGTRRRMLCISFAPVGDPPKGSTYSMRDEMKGHFCLDDFIHNRL